jgi:hypothetical protein
MRRYSIRTLMAFVLFSAVGMAAIRDASALCATVMTIVALTCFCVAVLWAILVRGRERAWWLGFALLGGLYLSVSLSPLRYSLGTTQLLEYVSARAGDNSIASFDISRFDQSSVLFRIVTPAGDVSERKVGNSVYHSTPTEELLASIAPSNRWRFLFPGAANFDAFQRIGHSLFSLLAGLVGGMVASWFYARQSAIDARQPSIIARVEN